MGGQQGSLVGMMLPLAMFAAIFYFLIIRPQKKKQKAHEEMLASISRGSTVVTAGGFFGVVREILDDSYIIELGDGVKARILKSSISMKKSEGSADSLKPKKKKLKRSVEENAETAETAENSENENADTPVESTQGAEITEAPAEEKEEA